MSSVEQRVQAFFASLERALGGPHEQSDAVQAEDHELCLGVQQGLASRSYGQGRYVPMFEAPMHHFHSALRADYARCLGMSS